MYFPWNWCINTQKWKWWSLLLRIYSDKWQTGYNLKIAIFSIKFQSTWVFITFWCNIIYSLRWLSPLGWAWSGWSSCQLLTGCWGSAVWSTFPFHPLCLGYVDSIVSFAPHAKGVEACVPATHLHAVSDTHSFAGLLPLHPELCRPPPCLPTLQPCCTEWRH